MASFHVEGLASSTTADETSSPPAMSALPNPPPQLAATRIVSRVLRRAWSHWPGGVWVAGLVSFALPVWWRLGTGAYESSAVLKLENAAALASAFASRATSAASAQTLLDLELLQEVAEATDLTDADPGGITVALAPPETAARAVGAHKYEFTCRASDPDAAQQRCEALTRTALGLGDAFRIVEPPTLPDRAAALSRGAVALTASSLGTLAGALWMLACALLAKRHPAVAEVVAVPPRPFVPSSIPPKPVSLRASWRVVSLRAPSNEGTSELPSTTTLQNLCSQVYLLAAQGSFVVGVSSWPAERDHKSRVAAQFAQALSAEPNARVLLLETDFGQPAVDQVTGVLVPSLTGFSQQLYLRSPEEQGPWAVARYGRSLSVLAEGRVRTPGLPKSARLISAIAELRQSYDIIVADAPVMRDRADLRLLSALADGIVVATADETVLSETESQLAKWFQDKRLLSVIMLDCEG